MAESYSNYRNDAIFNRTSKTGGVEFAVEWLTQIIDGWGMYPVLIVLFIFCALVGLFISNTATAILMAPIAISQPSLMCLPCHLQWSWRLWLQLHL